jgi:tRNA(adenine34) deaminase
MTENKDEYFMELALELALEAFKKNEVPVGAVLVKEGVVIAASHNQVEANGDATSHAEVLCIKKASQALSNWRLLETTLYVTLEPCAMCLGAILLSRVKRVVYAAEDFRHGACGSWVNLLEKKHPIHNIEITKGILKERSAALLSGFFKIRREKKNEKR